MIKCLHCGTNYEHGFTGCPTCKQLEATNKIARAVDHQTAEIERHQTAESERVTLASEHQIEAIRAQTEAFNEAEAQRQTKLAAVETAEKRKFTCGWCSAKYSVELIEQSFTELTIAPEVDLNHLFKKEYPTLETRKEYPLHRSEWRELSLSIWYQKLDVLRAQRNRFTEILDRLGNLLHEEGFCSPKCRKESSNEPSAKSLKANQRVIQAPDMTSHYDKQESILNSNIQLAQQFATDARNKELYEQTKREAFENRKTAEQKRAFKRVYLAFGVAVIGGILSFGFVPGFGPIAGESMLYSSMIYASCGGTLGMFVSIIIYPVDKEASRANVEEASKNRKPK